MQNITTVFDAQDLSFVFADYADFEKKDLRKKKNYYSTVRIRTYARFDVELGRDDHDHMEGRDVAFNCFCEGILRELEGPYEIVELSHFKSGLHKKYGLPRQGWWFAITLKHTADRPKNILTEADWQRVLPVEVIRDVMGSAVIHGAEHMVARITEDLEEQSIVLLAKGMREWVEDRALEITRYRQRKAALEAELKAEKEAQALALLDELGGESSRFKEAQAHWNQMTPAARALMLEAVTANSLTYMNGGWGLNTHLDNKLKQRLNELRSEHAH